MRHIGYSRCESNGLQAEPGLAEPNGRGRANEDLPQTTKSRRDCIDSFVLYRFSFHYIYFFILPRVALTTRNERVALVDGTRNMG